MNASNLYDPALIRRETDGQFWHPDLPFPEGATEDFDIAAALAAQGVTWCRVDGEDYPDDDGGDAYWAWMRTWQPDAPAGDGWRLCCIADTEDGPAAWWVRPLDGAA